MQYIICEGWYVLLHFFFSQKNSLQDNKRKLMQNAIIAKNK